MRICTNCGRILEDDEIVCRACNNDLILDTDGSSEESVSSDIMSDLYAEISSSEDASPAMQETADFSVTENETPSESDVPKTAEETDAVSYAPEEELSDNSPVSDSDEETYDKNDTEIEENSSYGTTSISQDDSPAESSEKDQINSSTGAVTQNNRAEKERQEKIKIISVRAPNDERLPHVNRSRVLLVISALLALSAVIFAVFMVVIPLVDARKQDEAARISAYMEYLEGKWLSETFIYSGQEFPSCEILELNRNNTFSTEIMTSPNDRETYDPETWTVTAEQSGQFRLELETSSLRVSYDDGSGNTMVYRRYIIKLDSQSLVLREYYNEKMTEYYDVIFSRYS